MGLIDDWAERWQRRAGDDRANGPDLRRALTAAGAKVNLAQPSISQSRRESWQSESWGFRDTIPEMRFAGDFVASTLGRLRVFPAENRPRGEEPVPLERASKKAQDADEVGVDQQTIEAAVAAVERLNLNQHGASLLSRLAENMEYAGECFLLGEHDDEQPGGSWSIRSISEVQLTQGGGRLVDPDSGMALRELKDSEVDLMRLWTPHPRFYDRPDAAVRSLLDVLEGMYLLGKRGRSHDRSRISAGKGLFIPQELLVMGNNGAPISADLPGSTDNPESSAMFERIQEYMTAALSNEGDPSAVVPLVFIGPAQIGDTPTKDIIGTFDLHGEDPKNLDERYEALVMRFARGINLAPERVKGLAESSNQWNAVTVTAEEVKTSVEPRAERLCDSLTAAYLQRMLRAMGVPPEQRRRVCLWFDSSELTQNPNRGQDATTLFNAGELSGDALRAANGFTEADAPSSSERLRRMLSTERLAPGSIPAAIALEQGRLPTVDDLTAVDRANAKAIPLQRPIVDHGSAPTPQLPKPATSKPGPPAAKPDPTPPVGQRAQPSTASQPGALGASAGRDQSGRFAGEGQARQWRLDKATGRKLTAIDRALGDSLLALAEAHVGRAREKAANRLRAEAVKTGRGGEARDPIAAAAFPKGCDPQAVVAAGGPWLSSLSARAEIDQLVDSAIDDLEPRFFEEIEAAARATADVLDALNEKAVTAAGARSRLVESIKRRARDAWRWLSTRLRDHARRLLWGDWSPSSTGESSGRLVPAALIRAAMAMAGGLPERSAGIRDDGTSAGEPLGGVASGEAVNEELRAAGALSIGFRWEYPALPRDHFPGHRDLDGIVFGSFDDPQLKTRTGDEWLGDFYHPLDHAGCRCWTSLAALAVPIAADADPNGDEVASLRRKVLGR